MNMEQYDTLIQAMEVLHKVFRFYGPSDVDDESILYAISSEKYDLKGILVNGYGVSSDALTQEMVEKLA